MNTKLLVALILFGVLSNSLSAKTLEIMREVVDGNGRTDTSFESYEPSYFGIVAAHSNSDVVGDVKFKLSLKYKLNEDYPLYFGYSQKSFWNITEDSAPFRESNYAPELFIKKRNNRGQITVVANIGFQKSYENEKYFIILVRI